jgi:hypothetical protein
VNSDFEVTYVVCVMEADNRPTKHSTEGHRGQYPKSADIIFFLTLLILIYY